MQTAFPGAGKQVSIGTEPTEGESRGHRLSQAGGYALAAGFKPGPVLAPCRSPAQVPERATTKLRSASASCATTGAQSPISRWRNSRRAPGYQGLSSRPSSQRQSVL